MKITIESTNQLTHLDGVPCRVWKGKTEGGVECFVFIHRLAVANKDDSTEFDTELNEQIEPGRVVSLRHIL